MCGIFGYVGKKETAAQMTLEGLKLLEYRGYDSWGVAVKSDKKIVIDKHTGMIGNASVNLPQSTIGIGHTRWATHGGVTVENAHPHMDCKEQIAVLHNGIVENFAQIKEELLKKNHTFSSQTDTEVIVHLIEENMKKHSNILLL
jgi:glucosamine--fructose-6-phosphate aminotransferase (isomerizing)